MSISKELFMAFCDELAGALEMSDTITQCPFDKNEADWYDEQGGWNPPKFCSVSFTPDYYGEISQECRGRISQCWINYVRDKFEGLAYDNR